MAVLGGGVTNNLPFELTQEERGLARRERREVSAS